MKHNASRISYEANTALVHQYVGIIQVMLKNLKKPFAPWLDRREDAYYNAYNFIASKTVEAGITAKHALTESRGAEKPAGRSSSNGPLRAQ